MKLFSMQRVLSFFKLTGLDPDLEAILTLASRNNNNHLKELIKYEDYQLNRNKISNSLIVLIRQ